MMQGGTEFVALIKEIAVKAVSNMNPCQIVFATADTVIKNESGEVVDLELRVNDKLLLSLEIEERLAASTVAFFHVVSANIFSLNAILVPPILFSG